MILHCNNVPNWICSVRIFLFEYIVPVIYCETFFVHSCQAWPCTASEQFGNIIYNEISKEIFNLTKQHIFLAT